MKALIDIAYGFCVAFGAAIGWAAGQVLLGLLR